MSKEKDVINNIIGGEDVRQIVNEILGLRRAQRTIQQQIDRIEQKRDTLIYDVGPTMEEELISKHLANAVIGAKEEEEQLYYKLIETCRLFTEQNKSSNQTDASNYSFETGV
jgi:hypothetical protein